MNKPAPPHELGIFQLILFALSLLVLGLLAVELMLELPVESSRVVRWVDNVVCALFFADFVVRFSRAESKAAFMKWGWLDLLASVPVIDSLRWARLFRVFRILRLLRVAMSGRALLDLFFQRRAGNGVASIGAVTFLVLSLSSAGILLAEQEPRSNIRTAGDAVWWSVTTVTTVGYGDCYPVTRAGRLIAAALMFTGVGIFGTLSGTIASLFLGAKKPEKAAEPAPDTAAILARLDALQEELNRLRPRPPEQGG
jgi:voltage-gated potassium channel